MDKHLIFMNVINQQEHLWCCVLFWKVGSPAESVGQTCPQCLRAGSDCGLGSLAFAGGSERIRHRGTETQKRRDCL